MLEFAASRGILLIASPPYTQKLNPVEGIIKILIRMALAMLRHAGAPKSLIEYSMSHATLLLNRLPRQKKGSGLVVALNLWLGLEPPSILHKLKVWGCAAYALVMGNRSKFDSKVYDVARSAYILCSLPHFKISYSAHVTFNEDDFPMRGQFKPDPEPFRLLEETPGPLLKHHTSGEVWTYGSSGERVVSADVGGHVPPGTLDPGAGLVRVHGHSGVGENSQPLERGRESRPGLAPLERGGSGRRPWVGDPTNTPLERGESGGAPPLVQGGVLTSLEGDGGGTGTRRSARGWQPSVGCLENIAHMCNDLAGLESELRDVQCMDDGSERRLDTQFGKAGGTQDCNHRGTEDHVLWFWECLYTTSDTDVCPKKHREAMNHAQARKVREAEIKEYLSHVKNVTFGPPLEPHEYASGPALKAVWVYSKSKKDPGMFKARVVMQGFLMQQGLHFNDVHAPVPAVTAFRVFMIGIASQGRQFEHWDIKTAFLTTNMDCEIDVTLPEAFNDNGDLQKDAQRSSTRHRVLKVIPGCPQGSKLWHADITTFLRSEGFVGVAPQEECLLVESGRPRGIHLLLWTDDICVSYSVEDKPRVRALLSSMKKRYPNGVHEGEKRQGEMTVLGTSVVHQGPRKLFIHQKPFLDKLLEKAGFNAGPEHGVQVPISPTFIFTTKDCAQCPAERGSEESRWYRSTLMSISYLANWTRPDVAFAVSKLARFMQAPGLNHIKELKRVLRYLRCHRMLGLQFDFENEPQRPGLYGYFDASFADCVDTRRSTIAFVFFFGGAVVSWKTKLHSFVTTSSNHSELVASAMAAREAKFLLLLLDSLQLVGKPGPAQLLAGKDIADLFTDFMGVVAISRSPALSTRHLEVADFYVRELVKHNIVTVSHVPTGEMLVDVLTKALGAPKFGAMIAFMVSEPTSSL